MRKILIMGLPGSGKTTLALQLKTIIGAVHFNADEVRKNINKDLGFSNEDRIEQARRMGWLCDRVVDAGVIAIADFVCPTEETRKAFGVGFSDTILIFVDRIAQGRFDDTNKIFQPPKNADIVVTGQNSAEYWANEIAIAVKSKPILSSIRSFNFLNGM